MDQSQPPVVIDNGSGFIKAGLSQQDSPKVIQPTIIGEPRMPGIMVGMDQKDYYVGRQVADKMKYLNIREPIVQGYIQNWQDMSKIWIQIFQQLNVSSKDSPLFFADTPLTPRSARQEMAQVMFQDFEAPFLYMYTQAVLSLFASGKTTGLVLDSGDGRTHAVPIYQGFALPHGILKLNVCGRDLTNYLENTLRRSGLQYNQDDDDKLIALKRAAIQIKERHCTVAYDFDSLLKNVAESGDDLEQYRMPDGNILNIGKQRFVCPEALFQPGMIKKESSGIAGIADTVFKAISNCDGNIRKDLYANIVLAGGTSMLKKLNDRLYKDVKALAPSTMTIKVIAPPERAYSAWLGGSILSSLSSFRPMFISKAEYMDQGSLVIYRKCF